MGLWTPPFPGRSPYHWHTRKPWKLEPLGAELMFPLTRSRLNDPSVGGGRLTPLASGDPACVRSQEAPFPVCGFQTPSVPGSSRWSLRVTCLLEGQMGLGSACSAPGGMIMPFSPSVTHPVSTLGLELRCAVSQAWGCYSSFNLDWLRATESSFLTKQLDSRNEESTGCFEN